MPSPKIPDTAEGWKRAKDQRRDRQLVPCNCRANDPCPQGRTGKTDTCWVWVNKDRIAPDERTPKQRHTANKKERLSDDW